MKRDALPRPDPAFPPGPIRLSDLSPAQYTALRSALDEAARRERTRVFEHVLQWAAGCIGRLFRRGVHRPVEGRLNRPCTEG